MVELNPDADASVFAAAAVALVFVAPVAFLSLYLVVRLRNVFPLTGREVRILAAFWVRFLSLTQKGNIVWFGIKTVKTLRYTRHSVPSDNLRKKSKRMRSVRYYSPIPNAAPFWI